MRFNKYEKLGGAYHWDRISLNPLKRNLYSYNIYFSVLKLIPNLGDKKLLDIGCGDGLITYVIKKSKGGDIYGIDNNDIAIKLANKKKKEKNYQVNYQIASCYDIPFPQNYFDIIISTDVIEHLDAPENMLEEAYKKLKKNGYMIHCTPIKRRNKPVSKHHVKEYTPKEYYQLLNIYLNHIQLIPINPYKVYLLDKAKLRILFNAISALFNINIYNVFRFFSKDYSYMIGTGIK